MNMTNKKQSLIARLIASPPPRNAPAIHNTLYSLSDLFLSMKSDNKQNEKGLNTPKIVTDEIKNTQQPISVNFRTVGRILDESCEVFFFF
jgi:hypothetical protein